MTTYYVKNGGSDPASGTSDANAWATTAKVNTEFANGLFDRGDSILFKRGSSWSITSTTNWLRIRNIGGVAGTLTIGAYDSGALPILDCGNIAGLNAVYISASDSDTSYWTLENLEIRNSGGILINIHGCTNWTIQNCTIHTTSDGGSGSEAGIYASDNCTSFTITGDTIHDTYGEGIYLGSYTDASDTTGSGTVSNNTLYDIGNEGIDLKFCTSNITVTGNTISRCNLNAAESHGYFSGGIKVGGHGHIISNNTIRDMGYSAEGANGIHVTYLWTGNPLTTHDITITGNKIDTCYDGIYILGESGNQFYDGLIEHNQISHAYNACIEQRYATDVVIRYNDLVSGGYGLYVVSTIPASNDNYYGTQLGTDVYAGGSGKTFTAACTAHGIECDSVRGMSYESQVQKTDANMQALWLMEEASGTRYDETANNNDLTDNNTVTSSTSSPPEGTRWADFEASSNEWLSIADNASLSITGSLSLCFWIRPESLGNYYLISKYNATGNQRGYQIRLSQVASGDLGALFSPNGVSVSTCYTGGGLITTATWYHVVLVYNGTDIRIYIDGVLASNGSYNPLAYTTGIYDNTAEFQIAARAGATTAYFDGGMDEAGALNRALTPWEVANVYENGFQGSVNVIASPSAVSCVAVSVDPSVQAGSDVSVAPAAVSAVAATTGGSIKETYVSPDALACVAVSVDPSIAISGSSMTISPGAASAVATGAGPAIAEWPLTATATEDTGLVLRLIYGDRRNPTRSLILSGQGAADHIFIQSGGFAPGSGGLETIYSGRTSRQDGQRRIASSRDNARLSLTYDLAGSSAAHVQNIQSRISRFAAECRAHEEKRELEEVWLEYRWHDGLRSLPAPVFGQFSHYFRVLEINVPGWPDSLHTGALVAGNVEGVVCDLVCEPYAYGLRQTAGTGYGQLECDSHKGVLLTSSITNFVTNPCFGYATWNLGWTASNADLLAYQETRAGFTRSCDSAAHLVNQSAGTTYTYTQTLTLTAYTYAISAMVRIPDGSSPVSAFQFYGQGAALGAPTVTRVDGGDWYYCDSSFSGLAVSSTHGVQVEAGSEIFVDNIQIARAELGDATSLPPPFCAGNLIGCAWTSTAHNSSSTRPDGELRWTLAQELTGAFTVGGWITPAYSNGGHITATGSYVWEYYADGYNYIRLYFDTVAAPGTARLELHGMRDGIAFSADGSALTFSVFEPIHVVTTHTGGTMTVYANGVSDVTCSVDIGFPQAGTFGLGCSPSTSETTYACNAYLDGWRIWGQALTATQVDQLYDNEKPVKDDYQAIGMPPFVWTKDGDNGVDAVNGAVSSNGKDNWCILAGVAGDVPAIAEYHIDVPDLDADFSRVYWLGRKAADEAFDPNTTLWLEYDGTADVGTSSGDAYQVKTSSGSGTDTEDYVTALNDIQHARGACQVLGRFYVAGASISVKPYFQLGTADMVFGDAVTVAATSTMLLRDFGDMLIDWPSDETPPAMDAGIFCTETAATVTTLRLDFLQLLPRPWCRVEAERAGALTIGGGDILIVKDRAAWVTDDSNSDAQLYRFLFRGDEVTLEPDHYNYVFLIQGEEGTAYGVNRACTLVVYVTPRWLLPGGAVS